MAPSTADTTETATTAPAAPGPGAAAAVGVWPGIGWSSALLQPLMATAVRQMADNVRAIDFMAFPFHVRGMITSRPQRHLDIIAAALEGALTWIKGSRSGNHWRCPSTRQQ